MNKIKQLWALLKFQPAINPFIFIFPVFFVLPVYFKYFSFVPLKDYHPSLDLLVSNSGLIFVGFIGIVCVAPEILQSGAMANSPWSGGIEFLLTRAIDRPILYRSRVAFFYLLILTIPLITFFAVIKNPDLRINEYNKFMHQEVLSNLPESISVPRNKDEDGDGIIIPGGNLLLGQSQLWLVLGMATVTQVLVLLIYPLKYRRFICFAVYFGFIFLPILRIGHSFDKPYRLSSDVRLFFSFAAHQSVFWILTTLALILGQLWCERRFARMEQ